MEQIQKINEQDWVSLLVWLKEIGYTPTQIQRVMKSELSKCHSDCLDSADNNYNSDRFAESR